MPQDWYTPTSTEPDWAAPALPTEMPSPSAYALRPLSTGELLDRTFSVYRSHFWLFAGLASLAGAWAVVVQALQMLANHLMLVHSGAKMALLEAQLSGLVALVLLMPVLAVVYAASVFALSEVYLGKTITAAEALKTTRGRWLRYVGISLWQGWSAIWVGALLLIPAMILIIVIATRGMAALGGLLVFLAIIGGGVYGVIAYIRNSLAVPSSVVEGSGIRPSMRRSKDLAKDTKGRIFVVMLVAVALYLVVVAIESPLLILIARHPKDENVLVQGILLLVGFLARTLVSPVGTIGLSLVYFDQRIRHEGFDLLFLLGPAAAAPVAVPANGFPESEPTLHTWATPTAVSDVPAEQPRTEDDAPPL